LSEFHQFHKELSGQINQGGSEISIPTTGEEQYTVSVPAMMENIQIVYNSIDSVKVGYEAGDNSILLDEKAREYLLRNAKMDSEFTFKPYADAEEMIREILDSRVYLMADVLSEDFLKDFAEVNAIGYQYDSKLQEMGLTKEIVTDMNFSKTIDDTEGSKTLYTQNPGQYSLRLFGKWSHDSSLKDIVLRIPQTGKETPFVSLQELGKDYAKNPFFTIPFNGYTGVGTDNERMDYGSGYYIELGSGEIRALENSESQFAKAETPFEIINYSEENETLPVLFGMDYAGGIYNTVSSPSIPVPIKLEFGAGEGKPSFQYVIGKQGTSFTPEKEASTLVTWYDCTNVLGTPVVARQGPSCNASSSPNESSSLEHTVPGQYYYTGMVLLPPEEKYLLGGVCSQSQAALETIASKITLNKDNPTTQLPFASLNKENAVAEAQQPPVTLEELVDSIAEGTSCGKISENEFKVIWNVEKIVPQNLTCQG
jgi:hypothetical protein